jgi:hypothetical protein
MPLHLSRGGRKVSFPPSPAAAGSLSFHRPFERLGARTPRSRTREHDAAWRGLASRTSEKTSKAAMREERLIENQEIFKSANKRLEDAVEEAVSGDQRVPFLRECADDDCLERVEMTLAQFSAVRSHDNRFFVVPGHPLAEGEEILEEHDNFYVTEK